MENFAALARCLVAQRAAIQVDDADSLSAAVADLLRNPQKRTALVENARGVLAVHQGATERTAELLLRMQPTAHR